MSTVIAAGRVEYLQKKNDYLEKKIVELSEAYEHYILTNKVLRGGRPIFKNLVNSKMRLENLKSELGLNKASRDVFDTDPIEDIT